MRQNDYNRVRGLCIVKNSFSKHNVGRLLIRKVDSDGTGVRDRAWVPFRTDDQHIEVQYVLWYNQF